MSTKYPGGIISKTPPVPAGPFENGAAPGIWTLEQQAAYVKQGIWPTAGNIDPSAFIENLFQTWVYTGNGTTQTINNGIDLAGKGGMVWGKTRDAVVAHTITDTVRGVDKEIFPNLTDAQQTRATGTGSVFAFNSNGFSTSGVNGFINYSGLLEVAWTFREQAKFFDIVTWTGDGSSNRQISHALGSVPGCIIVKAVSGAGNWFTYHRGLTPSPATKYVKLNSTDAVDTLNTLWNDTEPTSTVFTVGSAAGVNASGTTYVAYLFAHNAGGFGLTGTDNVISCGSFTGSFGSVNLGYEPQWLLVKQSNATNGWRIFDNMRGWTVGPAKTTGNAILFANTSAAEIEGAGYWGTPTATGFDFDTGGGDYIYIAIRRGPMKTPTTGTSVFSPLAVTPSTNTLRTIGFASDLNIAKGRTLSDGSWVQSRLIGFASDSTAAVPTLLTPSAAVETTGNSPAQYNYWNTTARDGAYYNTFSSIFYNFGRAPGFMDVVCYTGDATTPRTINHNLGVAPELIITKQRSAARSWPVRITALGNSVSAFLNLTDATNTSTSRFPVATYTGSTYVIGSDATVNASGGTYVAYLFASVAGVSKVGSYTGTGTTQTINCGFTGGARFVLIKRTDSTGDWYVWDTARGMIPANDPYLLLNSTAAEVTGTDFVDTTSVGFEITSTAPAAINANGGTFIFLAIA